MRLSRQTVYYHFTRSLIFFALSRKCAFCGTDKELQFDIIIPQGTPSGHHAKMSQTSRAAFYKREFYRGNLQILCAQHNSSKRDETFLPGFFVKEFPAQIVETPF